MKIVHVEERFHPAYGYQVQEFCRLHSKEHEVIVVTSDSVGKLRNDWPAGKLHQLDKQFEGSHGVKIVRLPLLFEIRNKMWLRGLVKTVLELKPDVVYSHGFEYLSLPRLLAAGVHKKCAVVTDSHDLPSADRHPLLTAVFRKLTWFTAVRTINKFQIPVYYTAHGTLELIRQAGINLALAESLPIGTDPEKYSRCDLSREQLRKDLGIVGDSVILYTGKHDYEKRPDYLLRALAQLGEERIRGVELIFVGHKDQGFMDTEFNPTLAVIESLGCRVHLVNAVPSDQLYKYYSAADLGVFPRLNTLSSMDALACGLPLILPADATNEDRLGGAGLIFKPDSVDDLAKAISSMLNCRETWTQLGRKGRDHVVENFNYSSIVHDLEIRLAKRAGML